MKTINNMDLMSGASLEIANYKRGINEATTTEKVKAGVVS